MVWAFSLILSFITSKMLIFPWNLKSKRSSAASPVDQAARHFLTFSEIRT